MAKEARITVGLDRELKQRLERAAEITTLKQSKLIEFALEALCESCEEHRELTFPFKLLPRSKYLELLRQAEGESTGLGELLLGAPGYEEDGLPSRS